jgi:salicylate biosynthesis isochorismate synthase
VTAARVYATEPHGADRTWLARADARLRAQLAVGAARARAEGRSILVSVSLQIPSVDPLAALEWTTRAAASDGALARLAAAGRMYWTGAHERFALAALGATATFAPSGADRFAAVDRAWRELIDGAVIDDDSGGADHAGPLLLGGFSFEAGAPRSERWRGFPDAHFVVPRILLTDRDGECALTISAIVDRDGAADVDATELVRLCRTVLTPAARGGDAPAHHEDVEIAYASLMNADAWMAVVSDAVAAIHAGALQKVVLARAAHAIAPRTLDLFALLRYLRATQPDCFVFGYWRDAAVFAGASPERLVCLDGRELQASSLAGSARRGASVAEDDALAAALLASAKDRGEHTLVSDALRDTLSELCDDVSTAVQPTLLTLAHVHHLHTPVRATLRKEHSLLDVVARLHPTPAVGGAPQAEALSFIRAHEQLDRGWYAAPIGWVGRESGEFAVALRSGVIAGATATLFAGCGIVADSEPALELAESELKLRVMQEALRAAAAPAPPVMPGDDKEPAA